MQNRNLYIIIGILILLNLFSIGTFWFRTFDRKPEPPPFPPLRPELVMAEELGLTPEQAEKFAKSVNAHRQASEKIIAGIFEKKNALMQLVFSMETDKKRKADSIIAEITRSQTELELITFKHFSELASYCEPHQLEKLKRFTMDMSQKWHRRDKPPLPIR